MWNTLGVKLLQSINNRRNNQILRCAEFPETLGQQAHEKKFFLSLPDNDNLSTVHIAPSPPPPPTPAPPPTESVVMGGRTVTLVGQRLCWSDALFYCRHHHWDLLSLHSKEEQSQVEKLLSVSHFPLTGNVWLGLRRYSTLVVDHMLDIRPNSFSVH